VRTFAPGSVNPRHALLAGRMSSAAAESQRPQRPAPCRHRCPPAARSGRRRRGLGGTISAGCRRSCGATRPSRPPLRRDGMPPRLTGFSCPAALRSSSLTKTCLC